MRFLKIAIVILTLLGVIFLCGYLLLRRNLEQLDFEPMVELFKARLGEVVVAPMWRAREEKESAQLFETYLNALQVGVATKGAVLPETSSQLLSLDAHVRLDAWGRPFCLSVSGEYVAVMSAGPRSDLFRGCEALHKTLGDLSSIAPGKLYEHPSGALVLRVKRE